MTIQRRVEKAQGQAPFCCGTRFWEFIPWLRFWDNFVTCMTQNIVCPSIHPQIVPDSLSSVNTLCLFWFTHRLLRAGESALAATGGQPGAFFLSLCGIPCLIVLPLFEAIGSQGWAFLHRTKQCKYYQALVRVRLKRFEAKAEISCIKPESQSHWFQFLAPQPVDDYSSWSLDLLELKCSFIACHAFCFWG